MASNETDDAQQRMAASGKISSYTGRMPEAGVPTRNSIDASMIASAIAHRWSEQDSSNVEMLAPTLVYLRQHRLLESVFDDAASALAALEMLTKVRKSGVDVAVILPVAELGRAHEELWGTGLVLHGWVENPDGIVRFTGPEVA